MKLQFVLIVLNAHSKHVSTSLGTHLSLHEVQLRGGRDEQDVCCLLFAHKIWTFEDVHV